MEFEYPTTDIEIKTEIEPETKIDIETEMNKQKFYKDIFNVFNIECNTEEDLFNITLDMDTLRSLDIIEKIRLLIPKYKENYNSNFLKCLHSNSTNKQKLPAINFIRQILKCNKYKLKGYYICMGYEKSTGKKKLKRLYKIIPLESPNIE
jgi:hypothetical protein